MYNINRSIGHRITTLGGVIWSICHQQLVYMLIIYLFSYMSIDQLITIVFGNRIKKCFQGRNLQRMTDKKRGVLFVCLGNICRSPIAEAVFQHLIEQRC